ncbi:MAG: coenzyme F420-0:L-glutamate ligase [Actinobacteria bacterium]|nr:coenzyme F420-0:L-glutamate ligase [Actinomycetota bacterium]
MNVQLVALPGIPEIRGGDDLAEIIGNALAARSTPLDAPCDGDIVVIAQKIVSKAEGRTVRPAEIEPSEQALELAQVTGKDPREIQAILGESSAVLRAEPGVLIVETIHGFVCANAGIDRSNVPDGDSLLLLPADPDASARDLRQKLTARFSVGVGVIVTDSFGRAWRTGQSDVAIGCAGIRPLLDLRGETDVQGRELSATIDAVADELAGAANLARQKSSREPVVLVRGRGDLVVENEGEGAASILRDRSRDLFR